MPFARFSKVTRIVLLGIMLIACTSPATPTSGGSKSSTSAPAPAASQATPTQIAGVPSDHAALKFVKIARWGDGFMNEVQWSPDGKAVAVAATPGIWLLEPETLTPQRLIETWDPPQSVSFTSDGLLTTWSQTAIYKWNAADGQGSIASNPGFPSVSKIAFSPDGQLAAFVYYDAKVNQNLVELWDIAKSEEVHTVYTGTEFDAATALTFSPDDKRLAGVTDGNTIRFWDTATGQEISKIDGAFADSAVAFSPDGRLIAGSGVIWDISTGKQVRTLGGSGSYSYGGAMVFSPDGSMLAVSGRDGTQSRNVTWLWPLVESRQPMTLPGDPGAGDAIRGMAFSPDSHTLATVDSDDLRLWDTTSGVLRQTRHHTTYGLTGMSADGNLIGVSTPEGAKLLDVASHQEKNTVAGADAILFPPNNPPVALEVTPDKLTFKDAATGQDLRSFGMKRNVASLYRAYSPDGTAMLTSICSTKAGDVTVWDLTTGQELGTAPAAASRSQCGFAISPDKRTLAVAVARKRAVYSLPDGQLIKNLKDGVIGYWGPAYSADGHWLAYPATGRGNPVYVYNTNSFELAQTLNMPSPIWRVALSTDGRLLVTASEERVELWDVDSGQSLGGFPAQAGSVYLSPDGRRIFTNPTGVVEAWDVQ